MEGAGTGEVDRTQLGAKGFQGFLMFADFILRVMGFTGLVVFEEFPKL